MLTNVHLELILVMPTQPAPRMATCTPVPARLDTLGMATTVRMSTNVLRELTIVMPMQLASIQKEVSNVNVIQVPVGMGRLALVCSISYL